MEFTPENIKQLAEETTLKEYQTATRLYNLLLSHELESIESGNLSEDLKAAMPYALGDLYHLGVRAGESHGYEDADEYYDTIVQANKFLNQEIERLTAMINALEDEKRRYEVLSKENEMLREENESLYLEALTANGSAIEQQTA